MAKKQNKSNRVRSSKVNLWMRPELLEKVNTKADQMGLSRDGAFEKGMNLWVSFSEKGLS